MSEHHEEGATPAKKEAAVLSDTSLSHLANDLGSNGLVMAMYLNIPTTTLVNMRIAGSDKGKSEDSMGQEMLLYWKKMRESAKDKDKVADVERALREIGKQELADILMDRHQSQMELTPDCFPTAN